MQELSQPRGLTLTLQTCAEEKRVRARQMCLRAARLRRTEAYLTVREVLAEASTGADGVLWREFSGFDRFRSATLGLSQSSAGCCPDPAIRVFELKSIYIIVYSYDRNRG